jgi:UDPglucose 6-dehydrogenase
MRVGFAGMTHLGQTMAEASEIRGFQVERFDLGERSAKCLADCKIVFITRDVESNDEQTALHIMIGLVMSQLPVETPIVVMSQVGPGFTRPLLKERQAVYYQVDTLIVATALDRALNPERHIIGCADPSALLPMAYIKYLSAFPAPIMKVGIESAELAKLAINFMLATQISAANVLSSIAGYVGADWSEVIPTLRSDKRLGERAYFEPGRIGGHLPRDVRRIRELTAGDFLAHRFAEAIGPLR